ncbi:MAG TPA: S1 RNA-binding domain-containing protein [Anaerolineae bacterium]|nr:S1 RNA-binding domain-containing protein [Anaerolineae bacterium]
MDSGIITDISNSDKLKRKMHLKGKVVKTSTAGAIVDIGVERPALLHVSQIILPSDKPIKRVSDFLKEGQELEVWVHNVQKDRIEVTMKEPNALEWREIKKNMVVKGKIVKIENFGAFVDIGSELPGLIHISELTQDYVKATSDIVNIGDEVEVKIIDFNRRRKQIKLSMKALQPKLEEIEGVSVTPVQSKRKPRKRKEKEKIVQPKAEEPVEPEPTTMEIALRAAIGHVNNNEGQIKRDKHGKTISEEQENIFRRTLDRRL